MSIKTVVVDKLFHRLLRAGVQSRSEMQKVLASWGCINDLIGTNSTVTPSLSLLYGYTNSFFQQALNRHYILLQLSDNFSLYNSYLLCQQN